MSAPVAVALDVAFAETEATWLLQNERGHPPSIRIPTSGLDATVRLSEQRGEWFAGVAVRGMRTEFVVEPRFVTSSVTPIVDLGLRSREWQRATSVHPSASMRIGVAATAAHATGEGTQVMFAPHFALGSALAFGTGGVRPFVELRADAIPGSDEWRGVSTGYDEDRRWNIYGGNASMRVLVGVDFR